MKTAAKIFVVTGGGNGIGRAVVLELLRRGAWVAAVDIRAEDLEGMVELAGAGDRLATFVADITDRDAVEALPHRVIDRFGAVDGVINVAGIIQPFHRLNDLDYEDIERVINVNLYGTIHVVKAFLPHLLQRPIAHLATVSSMGGFLPVPGQTIYGASKAGVKLMTEGLYAELLDTNVAVSVAFPGPTNTDIAGRSGVEVSASASDQESRFPMTSPEEAATIILDGIEEDRLHIYVGRTSLMMSLLNRAAPKGSTHVIYRQMKSLLERS